MKKSQFKKLVKEEIFSILEKEKAKKAKKAKEDVEVSDIETETSDDSDMGDLDLGDMGDSKMSTAQDVQKELMDALEAAKGLGDKKLVRQIGNALTYFTRSQVSKDEQ